MAVIPRGPERGGKFAVSHISAVPALAARPREARVRAGGRESVAARVDAIELLARTGRSATGPEAEVGLGALDALAGVGLEPTSRSFDMTFCICACCCRMSSCAYADITGFADEWRRRESSCRRLVDVDGLPAVVDVLADSPAAAVSGEASVCGETALCGGLVVGGD